MTTPPFIGPLALPELATAGDNIIIDTPTGIEYARLAALKGRLRLEMQGIRFKGRATTTIVAEMMGVSRIPRKQALDWVVKRMATMLAQRESEVIAEQHHHAGHHWTHFDSGCRLCRERIAAEPADWLSRPCPACSAGIGKPCVGMTAPLRGLELETPHHPRMS